MSQEITVMGMKTTTRDLIVLAIGPLIWITFMLLPLGGTVTARGGLGALFWTAWYWGTGVIPTGYTVFIPILGTAFLPGMEWGQLTKSLIHPSLMMLLGPAIIVCMWSRWGFTRRVALFTLSLVGTGVRAQAVTWLVLATSISFIAANTVITIALTPIAVEMLRAVGYDTIPKMRKSLAAVMIILAVAIGSSLGGFMTPMAGGQAVITWSAIGEGVGSTVTMWGHTSRMIVPVFLSMIPVIFLFWKVFPTDVKIFKGSEDYFSTELEKMGPVTKAESWGVVWFLFAVAMPFLQPLWQPFIPDAINITPSMIFTVIILVMALIPAPDTGANIKPFEYEKNERFISANTLRIFPIHAFMLWPIAMSIAQIIADTGAGDLVSQYLGSYWEMSVFAGVGMLVIFSLLLAQPGSDAGAAGMLAPVVLSGTLAAGVNPIVWLFIMGYTVNFSFCIPAATGTMGVSIAFGGKTHYLLPVYGLAVVVACGLVSWLFWGSVIYFDWTFWQTVPTLDGTAGPGFGYFR